MEMLMFSMLMAWGLTRYGITDAIAAAKGTESPRVAERRQRAAQSHERAMTRMGNRTGPTVGEAIGSRIVDRIANPRGPREPGPARQALGSWWADSWAYATERRRRRHERAANGDLGRQRAARAAKRWVRDQQQRRARQRNGDDTPPLWADAEVINDPDQPRPAPTGDDDVVDAEVLDPDPGSDPVNLTKDPNPATPDSAGPESAGPDPDGHDPAEQWKTCPDCLGERRNCTTCGNDGRVPAWLFDPAQNSAADQWQACLDRALANRADTGQPGQPGKTDRSDVDTGDVDDVAGIATDNDRAAGLDGAADQDPGHDLGEGLVVDDRSSGDRATGAAAIDPAGVPAAPHDPFDDAGSPLASVHPIREDIPTMSTTEHTMSSGETLDPHAALNFVTGITELTQRVFTELELSVSTLRERGVAGAPIELLEQMQEAAQVLVVNSEAAKGHFERHVATQDTVLSDDTLAGTVNGTYVGTVS